VRVSLKSAPGRSLASADRGSLHGRAAAASLDTITISKERIMRNRGLQLALFVAAVAAGGTAGATAESSPQSSPKSIVVRYSESDLASDNGAAHLYSMLDRAARFVCDDSAHPVSLVEWRDIRRCEQAAIATAVSELSSANLTTVYNRHFRNSPLVEKERLSEHTRRLVLVAGLES
jgi:UrcA family protein